MNKSIKPGAIWPDTNGVHINAHGGGILYHQGVYYWFGEHKVAGEIGNSAQIGVSAYSSTDLYNWTNHGTALKVHEDPSSDITRGCVLERPKVIFNPLTNKFVMWFHLELKGQGYAAARAGVAISDHVTGPYTFIRSFRNHPGIWPENSKPENRYPLTPAELELLNEMQKTHGRELIFPLDSIYRRDFHVGQMSRDMNLFVDDDGKGYQFTASEENGVLHISELTPDFLGTTGRYIRIFENRYHEAPAVFKHHGRYFMFSSDCTGWAPNPARLSVADNVWGPWTELGNPCRGTEEQVKITYDSQSTYVLPIQGKPDAFIFLGDRWCPQNAIDGRYIWLPIQFDNNIPYLTWQDEWDLSVFD